ncbi:glycine--tRNA ligase subunit beta [Kordiimonas sp. SCSIO 12603]|uniref:glycine--tRNA ligase subunit beta n=1 Tax=Kordiimonas sp. SCSIO 12603 TaxID=2829596 RepID=UPI002106B922|nr:glycine--tRNA ligase subunit beta [Kordiimonas sp. SCSIO 12603]UTW57989.1 glycine--tRNA ligase subunit beta [Kordiimonas sp. SCSIO 12603]
MADLLIELFSEEIPARMQGKAADDLKKIVTSTLKEAGLTFDVADAYSTPRRLALSVTNLPAATPDISEERRGPRVDAPEKALEGFMRGAGVTRDQLEEREEKKGTFFFAKIEKPGRAATEVIAEAVENAVRNFPWPKSQRWGSGSLKWVRPLHSILCVLGGETVELEVEGYRAGNTTRGHRFMAPDEFTVSDFADYKAKLLEHKVVLDATRRETLIYDTAQTLAQAAGLELVEDRGLLTEVAGLVEWPVPMIGAFDPAFLEVPEEVLILTMRKDQKYFVTRDPATGKLANKFIFTANLEPSDDGSAVTNGNQRVVSARLADAKFFWDQDLKRKLDDNLPALKEIVFHKDLGLVSDRVERMTKLAGYLAEFVDADKAEAERATELAKADLVSNMVYEFPEVQGAMGRYYAQKQGETDAVADAIRDHYAPAGPSDACPSAPVSIAVALAEKLDTLVGFFGIDQKPTGSKDPFALRRSALGVIRLITENGVRVPLTDVFKATAGTYSNVELQDVTADLLAFFGDRLKVQQRDKGVRHDLIDAVFADGDDDLVRILNRVAALSTFLATDDGTNLLAGYKRAANILKAEEKKEGKAFDASVDASKFELAEEKALGEALVSAKAGASEALEAEDFEKAMSALSTLRAPIDAFFDKVIVNADDADVRANRLALLTEIRAAVNTVADFGLIEG